MVSINIEIILLKMLT